MRTHRHHPRFTYALGASVTLILSKASSLELHLIDRKPISQSAFTVQRRRDETFMASFVCETPPENEGAPDEITSQVSRDHRFLFPLWREVFRTIVLPVNHILCCTYGSNRGMGGKSFREGVKGI